MNVIGTKINKDYAWEIAFLYKYQNFSEGLTVFQLNVDAEWYKGDHNPRFEILLIIFNFMIFDFSIYNIHHVDNPDN
jgi:hypothetical protein